MKKSYGEIYNEVYENEILKKESENYKRWTSPKEYKDSSDCKVFNETIKEIEYDKEELFKRKLKLIISNLDEFYYILENKTEDQIKRITFDMTIPELTDEEMEQLPEDFVVKYNELINYKNHHMPWMWVRAFFGLCVFIFMIIMLYKLVSLYL